MNAKDLFHQYKPENLFSLSGKTALLEHLCKAMRDRYSIAVVTNDIYTREDAEALMRMQILPEDRVMGVETGG